jgi:hypothetical protein
MIRPARFARHVGAEFLEVANGLTNSWILVILSHSPVRQVEVRTATPVWHTAAEPQTSNRHGAESGETANTCHLASG